MTTTRSIVRIDSGDGPTAPRRRDTALLTTLQSDSHTWNLVFLQIHLEGLGYDVVNLGPCVPDELIVQECRRRVPDLVVVSTLNGHGVTDGLRVIRRIRSIPAMSDKPVVIGGKLGVGGRQPLHVVAKLVDSGYDAVFDDGAPMAEFDRYLHRVVARHQRAVSSAGGTG
ncbi:cobalamin B12-binding domain-containing protein [Polymorphospora rubra]|uniref:cobalamin B12-binding domain-containing protein n=1 Tax=Polymorphospora rubra TaxID=338584 RepID=UPI0031DAD642